MVYYRNICKLMTKKNSLSYAYFSVFCSVWLKFYPQSACVLRVAVTLSQFLKNLVEDNRKQNLLCVKFIPELPYIFDNMPKVWPFDFGHHLSDV